MPNHVTNKLRITDLGGVDLDAVQSSFLNSDRQVDFNVIAEMPQCLKDFQPHYGVLSRAKMALGLLPDINELNDGAGASGMIGRLEVSNALRDASTPINDKDIKAVIRAISNHQQCGHMYWYDWSNDHWGTKWNAYGQPDGGFENDDTAFEFETAWSHPFGLIEQLSKRNPAVTFAVEFADEDIGSNCGSYTIKNGELLAQDIAPRHSDQTEEQKKTYMAFAFRVRYGDEDPASHGYDENWEYSDALYDGYHATA